MPMFRKTTSKIVKDHKVLDFNYIPPVLVHREEQMERLSSLFSPILDNPVSQNAFFHGPVGTGKTSMAHRFCLDFIEEGKGTKAIDYKIVNCRDRRTSVRVLHDIASKYQAIMYRGYSIIDLLDIFRKDIVKRGVHFIVVLDEVDALIAHDGSKAIYHLTRFDEQKASSSGSVSLIMISTRNVLVELDPATMSTFKRSNVIDFGRYSKVELLDIIEQRVRVGFHPNTIKTKGKSMIAEIAAGQGDARRAIELLQVAAAYADKDRKDRISLEHIRKAKSQVDKVDIEPSVRSLNKHKKITLLAIARALRRNATVRIGEVEKNYRVVCEETNETARAHTQFWKYVKELSILGIIDTSTTSPGRSGISTMISLNEIPTKVLIKVLEDELL